MLLAAHGQEVNANHTHYSTEKGLSSNAISDIQRDYKGYVWISTWNGLCRFDGFNFRVYTTGPMSGIPYLHNRILDIYPDCGGNVWMRMYDHRVYVLNRHTDCIQSAFTGEDAAELKKSPRRLTVSPDGSMYARIADDGIYQFRIVDGKIERRHYSTGKYSVRNIIADSHKGLWIETAEGLVYMNTVTGDLQLVPGIEGNVISWMYLRGESLYISRKGGEIDRIDVVTPLKYYEITRLALSEDITSISIDKSGRIWYTTSKPGVSMYNPQSGVNKDFRQVVLAPENDIHGATVQDVNGVVWVRLFHGGFGYYDEKTGNIEYFHNSPDNMWNLSNTVISYLSLPEEVLLMSTNRRGLEKIDILNQRIERNYLVPELLDFGVNETRAMLWERKSGKLLIGNKRGDIYCDGKVIVSTGGRIYHLMQDHTGLVWISDKSKGLFTYDVGSGKLTNVGDFKDNIYQTFEDRDGVIWVADYTHGVFYLKNGRKVKVDNQPADSYNKVRTICQVANGDIWAGTTDGILIIHKTRGRYVISPLKQTEKYPYRLAVNDIIQIAADKNGEPWIATNGGGLSHVVKTDSAGEKICENDEYAFQTFSEAYGLPSDEIRSITFDKRGNVWFAADQYICSYDPQKGFITTFGMQDGVGDVTCSESGSITLPDGRMMFGTLNGYYVVDEKKLAAASGQQIKLAITDFFVNEQLASPRLSKLYDYDVIDSGTVEVPSRVSAFSFRFASLNFQLQHRVHYQYMLEDYDKEWRNADRRRMAFYSDIPAGTYKFRVRAFLLETPDKFDEQEMTIIVPPYTFLSATALWIYAVILVLAVVFYMFLRKKFFDKRMGNMRVLKVSPDEVAFQEKNDYDFVKVQLDWLEEHYGDSRLKIDEMADVAQMSRTSFYNELKALTGKSPKEFVTEFRLKKACMYLSHNDRTIAEIAYHTGFNDPVYFARSFKQKMGITPSAYREKALKEKEEAEVKEEQDDEK